MNPHALNIYTDGSSYSHPRKGGVGVRFVFPEFLNREDLYEDLNLQGYKDATNNQMELKACSLAIQEASKLPEIKDIQQIVINTDSMYVIDNYPRSMWWSQNKWMKNCGQPVLNAELWNQLLKNIKNIGKRVSFEWVKGHSKNQDNKAVDKLAKKSAKGMLKPSFNKIKLRRKLCDKNIEAGSVKMLGQRIRIRIIRSSYQRLQQLTQYVYEIISKTSKFYKCVDILYDEPGTFKSGHKYSVRFNKDCKNPKVIEIFKEIIK